MTPGSPGAGRAGCGQGSTMGTLARCGARLLAALSILGCPGGARHPLPRRNPPTQTDEPAHGDLTSGPERGPPTFVHSNAAHATLACVIAPRSRAPAVIPAAPAPRPAGRRARTS